PALVMSMPRFFRARGLGALVVVLALAPLALGQSGGLTPTDVARIQMVGAVDVAPDGARIVYTKSVPRDPFESNAGSRTELYLYDVAADEHHALRTGEGSASRVRWTPDGRLSFLTRAADGDARPSLYVMDIATREMERALAFGASIGVYDWSPSGDRI